MSQPAVTWTSQQKTAITQRDRDLLVTASAGTGKTAVLSQRCLDILCEPNTQTSVLNMLILTFTDAAAEEMRTRIREQLTTAVTKDRELRHRLQTELQRTGATEQQCASDDPRRPIAAKEHERESDEAAARCHSFHEGVRQPEHEAAAREPRTQPTDDTRRPADRQHAHALGVRRLGALSDRADRKTPASPREK